MKNEIDSNLKVRNHINFSLLESNINIYKEMFSEAIPFPYLIIDDVLSKDSLRLVLDNIPPVRSANRSSDYIFAKNKFENPTFYKTSTVLNELKVELLGDRFRDIISNICGQDVFMDPEFLGGGIHQGGPGSFLDMHVDFSRHPLHKSWLRELNILIYLNENYRKSWGGELELFDEKSAKGVSIAPIANRMVIMLTKDYTLHGYKKISFPQGFYRTSLAGYAYTCNLDYVTTPSRSTRWVPDTKNHIKIFISKVSPKLVSLKNRYFGSATARRAKK